MSNGEVEYQGRFFYLRVPPRQVSPPVLNNDSVVVNYIGPGSANQPIEIYDGSSDEVASTDLIDPSLCHASPAPGDRIPTPGSFLNNPTAPPGIIPTQPAPNIEPNIPVPALNKPDSYFYEMLVQNGPNHYECAERTV
jgi:hypothetical protein